MKKIILIIFGILIICQLHCQENYLNIGLSSSKCHNIFKPHENIKFYNAPYVGISTNRRLNSNLFLNISLEYVILGQNFKQVLKDYTFYDIDYKSLFAYDTVGIYTADHKTNSIFELHTFRLPLAVEFRPSNFGVSIGGFLSLNLTGNYSGSIYFHDETKNYLIDSNYEILVQGKKRNYLNNHLNNILPVSRWSYGFIYSMKYHFERLSFGMSFSHNLKYIDKKSVVLPTESKGQDLSLFHSANLFKPNLINVYLGFRINSLKINNKKLF